MRKIGSVLFVATILAVPAWAQGNCEACRVEDEQQIGSYVEPDITIPRSPVLPDPRGEEFKVPVPGASATVRVKPGSGLWLGSPAEGLGNVFLKGQRDKASVGWKLGF
jgi:hypothetical protein